MYWIFVYYYIITLCSNLLLSNCWYFTQNKKVGNYSEPFFADIFIWFFGVLCFILLFVGRMGRGRSLIPSKNFHGNDKTFKLPLWSSVFVEVRFTFYCIVSFFCCGIYSADTQDFQQLENCQNDSIILKEEEEEGAVGAVVRCYHLLLNILEEYCDLCIKQINGLKGFFLKGFRFWKVLYIHSIRLKLFPKNQHFLPFDMHRYHFVAVGKKCYCVAMDMNFFLGGGGQNFADIPNGYPSVRFFFFM